MMKRWLRRIKHHFLEVFKTKMTPHSIALGFAVGTFLSIFPTPGFSIMIGLFLLLIFENINKYSMFGSFIIWNPIVVSPLYYLGYQIGDFFIHLEPVQRFDIVFFNQAFNFTRQLIIGNTFLGIVMAVIGYYIVYAIANAYQKKHKDDA